MFRILNDMTELDSSESLAQAKAVITNDLEFGFVWSKQARFYRAATKQLRTKVRPTLFFRWCL